MNYAFVLSQDVNQAVLHVREQIHRAIVLHTESRCPTFAKFGAKRRCINANPTIPHSYQPSEINMQIWSRPSK